jgi:hypothetical protein
VPRKGERLDPDDINLDDIFDFDDEEEPGPTPPDLHITIRGRPALPASWAPYLVSDGPDGDLVRERADSGVTIADVWMTGGDSKELIVRYRAVTT